MLVKGLCGCSYGHCSESWRNVIVLEFLHKCLLLAVVCEMFSGGKPIIQCHFSQPTTQCMNLFKLTERK